jgi:hypothetical protein
MLLIDLGNPHVTYNSETHGGSLNVNYENGPKTGETIEPYWTRENYNGILAYKYNVSPDADITVTAGNGGPDADTYTLSCITDFTTGNPDNYKISVTGNNLIIDPKTVPVETGSATEAYDASNPDKAVTNSTAAIHNLALNDKDRVTIMATGSQIEIGSSENTYSINWGGVNPNNYNIVEHLGTLTKTSPVTGLFGFRERLTNKLTESFGTAVDSNSDKQAGADSSAAKDPKAEDDRKPAANQSGDNTGSKTTGDLKTDKNDKTSTGNGKTADRTEESKKDEASSDAGKDESGKTESEKAEVTESEKSEEAEPEKTESSESGKTETTEVYKPEEEKPEHTIVVITTDGEENSSREYTLDKVKRLVKRMQEKHNWEFMFLGANIDAISAAGRIGISADRAVRYKSDRRGTALNYKVVGEAMACMRACRKPISKDWKAEIEEDVARRGE